MTEPAKTWSGSESRKRLRVGSGAELVVLLEAVERAEEVLEEVLCARAPNASGAAARSVERNILK